jgi:hypothetical protein
MRPDYQQLLNEIEHAINKAEPHLKVEGAREALATLRAQAENWRKIDENVGAIRSEIITPVNRSLATGNRLSNISLWVGIIGGVISVVLFLVSNPFGTAKDIVDIEGRLQSLENMTRTALSQSSPTLAAELQVPTEGEIEIRDGNTVVVLRSASGTEVALQLIHVDSEVENGIRRLHGLFHLNEDGRQVGGSRLAELTGRRVEDLLGSGNRFKVTSGESFRLYEQRFEATRVLSVNALGRDGYADDMTAVFLRQQD